MESWQYLILIGICGSSLMSIISIERRVKTWKELDELAQRTNSLLEKIEEKQRKRDE